MNVITTIKSAQNQVIVRRVIIWNPYSSRALFVGPVNEVPKTLLNKNVNSYRYDKDKQRMILRVQT